MSVLRGLPDFQRPILESGFGVFSAYEDRDKHLLLPDGLEVDNRKDGRPDFSLELVRGKTPFLPPQPYGVLDFRLRPTFRWNEALAALSARAARAALAPVLFTAGFFQLQTGGQEEIPADIREPIPMTWSGVGVSRCVLRVSRDTAILLKEGLLGEVLLLEAVADVEMEGVTPRLPLRVRFDPPRLLAALIALADDAREIAREDLLGFFRRNPEALPLDIHGSLDAVPREEFSEALTDRVRLRFATLAASPLKGTGPRFALPATSDFGAGRFEWDLSEPVRARRPLRLRLDPLAAARALVQEQGVEAVFRETVVPPIPTGAFLVSISANLPPDRVGVAAVGATIRVPPRPPQRIQATVETAELNPPDDATTVRLRLSPLEPLEYTYSTFVVVETSDGSEQLEGEWTPHAGDRLDLSPDDFPVAFVSVEAAPDLLEIGEIDGVLLGGDPGEDAGQTFHLDLAHRAVALPLARGTADATMELAARSRDGATLRMEPVPAAALQVGLHSFREYGPQKIEIECDFGNRTQSFALELLPEGRPETSSDITLLHFRPDRPKREWTWFAASPFQAGYRYRAHRSGNETPSSWSPVRSPFEPLRVLVADAARDGDSR